MTVLPDTSFLIILISQHLMERVRLHVYTAIIQIPSRSKSYKVRTHGHVRSELEICYVLCPCFCGLLALEAKHYPYMSQCMC